MGTVADVIRHNGHRVYTIHKDASMDQAVSTFVDKDVNALVVADAETVYGILTKNDLLRHFLAKPDQFRKITAGECATKDVFTATPQTGLADLLAEMVRRGIHNVPVIEGNKPVGMITSLDVVLEQKQSMRFENEQLRRYIYGGHYE